jgi:4-amino-4-deoxy-L-arabinose transferase-like glycosyltransferase
MTEGRVAASWSVVRLAALLFPFFAILALIAPPFDDEFYYWCWSRELQFSYYDHPPMVAYMIRLSTAVLGKSLFAIRFPAIVGGVVVLAVVWRLSKPRTLFLPILLTPVLSFGAVLITPDTPLMLFWALYLAWLVRIHERLAGPAADGQGPGMGLWVLGGVILGCGVLGKYTTGLAAIAGSMSFLHAGSWRKWLGGYLLHAAVSFLVASPILIHNIQHDFVPILYQWEHSMGSPEPGFYPFAEFVGIQLLFFGSVPFIVYCWSCRHWRELMVEPRLRACAFMFTVPFSFFLFKATRGSLEGNWAFPCFIAVWPLAAEWYQRVRVSAGWRWTVRAGFALPVGVTLFFAVHVIEPVWFIPPDSDRVTRQWGKLALIEKAVRDLHRAGYDGPVYALTYQWVAVLRWYGVDAHQLQGVCRPSHFTEREGEAADSQRKVIFTEAPEPIDTVEIPGIPRFRVLGYQSLTVRGEDRRLFWLLDCSEPQLARPARILAGSP